MWCLPPGNCPACPYGLTFRNCLWMWANICMKTIVSFHTKDENNISSELLSIPFSIFCTRACLKKAFCKMCVTICGIFCPDEGAVAGYGNWIRVKYPAKWGVQIAGMIFQTRSNVSSTLFYTCRFFCISSLNSLPLNNITATRNRKHINAPNILTVGFFTTLHKSKIPGRINPYPAAIIS